MPAIKIKRIYEPYSTDDGYRILIDRLWPRGIKKDSVQIDKWLKDVAPSTALRKEFNHQPEKWQHFVTAYQKELEGSPALDELVANLRAQHTVTLLFAARDTNHNHALVLQKFIEKKLKISTL